MRTFFKVSTSIVVAFFLMTLTAPAIAFEEISNSELASLYGGGFWGCDEDCYDIEGGCPDEVSTNYGCSGCHEMSNDGDDCVGGCNTISNQQCQNLKWQLIYITCTDSTVDCESQTGTFYGWCSFAVCGAAPGSGGAQCSDCTRADCPDGS